MARASDPIADFWKFWSRTKDRIAHAIVDEGGMSEALIEELNACVEAIDPDLQWEFGPGRKSEHHFCLSAAGDPRLLPVVARWLRAAPPADEVWEIYAGRQGQIARDPRRSLDIGGRRFLLSDVRVQVSPDNLRELLHLEVFHPHFASMEEGERDHLTFLLLDSEVGEANVERWIGQIAAATEAAADSVPLPELPELIAALAHEATGVKHALMEGTVEGKPVIVARNFALKRLDLLHLEMHVALTFPFLSPLENGFPTTEEGDALYEVEDVLLTALGENAVWIARETGLGKRVVHLHAMEGGSVATILDRFVKSLEGYAVGVDVKHDPTWEVLDRW